MDTGKKILVVCEYDNFQKNFLLSVEGVTEVYCAKNIQDAFIHLTRCIYHLIILESVWRIENVCKIIKTIRALKKTPILILTSKVMQKREIYIKAGADVVLSKDCSEKDLKLEVFSLIHRYSEWEIKIDKRKKSIQRGSFLIDFPTRKVFWKEDELKLSKHEFDLIYLLASSPGVIYTYSQIYQIVWGDYPRGDFINVVCCMIKRIKKKMRVVDANMHKMIHNVREVGYFYNDI